MIPKKKVFILINTLGTGGAERVVSLLIQNWKNRYDINLVLLTDLIEYELPENIRIFHLNQPFLENGFLTLAKLPILAWRYRQICKKGKADVSISFLKRPNYISCMSKGMGNKAWTIISERSYFSEQLKTFSPLQRRLSIYLTKKLYPRADKIITNSVMMKNDLKRNFNIKAFYEVIPNPMNIRFMKKMSEAEVNFPGDKRFTFIHVGAFRKEKNQKGLILAFDKIKHLNIRLVLLGHRYLKEELIALVKEMKLDGQITFLDFDTNPFKYFSKSDCFVLPSLFEGFPNSLVEAMSCGLSVISTDCKSGPREILAPGTDPAISLSENIEIVEYGILVPVNNIDLLAKAMERMASDPNLHQQMKEKAFARSLDFDSEKIIPMFNRLVDEQTY